MKRLVRGAVMLALLLLSCAIPALAETVSINLPVSMQVTGTLPPQPETFTLFLRAREAYAPMPGGFGGTYTLTLTGSSSTAFPTIHYHRPGVYHYEIRQQPGSNPLCTYDDSVILVDVCIMATEDGLCPVLVVQEQDGSTKLSNITFHNVYAAETPTPSPTPTDTPEVTETPSPTPEITPAPGDTTSPSVSPDATPTPTPTPAPGDTETPSVPPEATPTPTPAAGSTPTPRPSDPELPPTGVEDYWMYYLSGAAAFLLLAMLMLRVLLKPEEERDE